MFFKGTLFEARTAEVLEDHFEYRHGDMSRIVRAEFNAVCDLMQKKGGNRYDAATFFMLSLRKGLSDDPQWDEIKARWLAVAKETARFAAFESTRALADREGGL